LIFYPVRALLAVWLDEPLFDASKAPIWSALTASALGYLFFIIGYKIETRRAVVRRELWLDRPWNLRRAYFVSDLFLLVGLAGFIAVRVLGGSFLYFILLDPDIKGPQEIKPWFFYLLWICLLVQVGALIQFGCWLSTGLRPLRTALLCILALASTFPLARYLTVVWLIMVTLGWHYKKKSIKFIQVAILLLLVVGYLGIAGLYREWISPATDLVKTAELLELASQEQGLVIHYVVGNLEELYNLSDVMSVTPSELPYQFGATFTPVILKPVPRALMPTKPLGADALFTQEMSPEAYDRGLVTGLGAWGEWYLNFSWLGLTLGMTMIGMVSAFAYNAMRRTMGFGRIMLYSSFVIVLLSWLRSDFNSSTTYGLYYSIPIIAALAYITRSKPGAEHVTLV
jgi:hypothetical protein